MPELSNQQSKAVKEVMQWFKHDAKEKPIFRLFGYAGTGKTTIAIHIANALGINVRFCAYTGKAAHVMHTKGCTGATTIHSMIYRAKGGSNALLKMLKVDLKNAVTPKDKNRINGMIMKEREQLRKVGFDKNEDSDLKTFGLVIVDECSMVDKDVALDMLSYRVPILALGDPAQLPPVFGAGYLTNANPDFMLEEVHRHAMDSPIYRWATKVRLGQHLPFGERDGCYVKKQADLDPSVITDANIVLCGKNKTRSNLNRKIRMRSGFGKLETGQNATDFAPFERGEHLVCLKNDRRIGLQNGSLYRVKQVLSYEGDFTLAKLQSMDTDKEIELPIASNVFRGEDVVDCDEGHAVFDYGYCLTVHKSQGSQWEKVLICDESNVFKQNSDKWLYTAITRASDKVWITR